MVDTLCDLWNLKFKVRIQDFNQFYLFPVACHLDIPLRGAYGRSFDEGKNGVQGL